MSMSASMREGKWQEIGTDDVFFIPGGTTWQLFNHRGAGARVMMSLGKQLGRRDRITPPAAWESYSSTIEAERSP